MGRRVFSFRYGKWAAGLLIMGVANIIMAHPQQGSGLVEDILSGHGKFMTYLGTLIQNLVDKLM